KESPFTITKPAEDPEEAAARIKKLEDELQKLEDSGTDQCSQRRIKKRIERERAPVHSVLRKKYDIIMGTVDMILAKLMKKKNAKNPCPIQELLETSVQRIVVDEASQITEAAFNALELCFPLAQIVLIGDTKQLPPFKFIQDDIVSELSGRSALEVLQRKANISVITLSIVYRAAASVMAHTSDVFYDKRLISGKQESRINPLTDICKVYKRCIFVQVDGKSKLSGTSQTNHEEATALEFLIKKLYSARYDFDHIMVVAYYDSQRKLVEGRLPKGYEVLTVDSSQGREKDIVIVLTTRTSYANSGFFTCPLRANVATSRQKEALIVLGHKSLLETEPWSELLTKGYFQHVVFRKKTQEAPEGSWRSGNRTVIQSGMPVKLDVEEAYGLFPTSYTGRANQSINQSKPGR
ncbi:hypothetical protein PFISCL1PPCAC_7583, partial [Pristionchus fissidentatus]